MFSKTGRNYLLSLKKIPIALYCGITQIQWAEGFKPPVSNDPHSRILWVLAHETIM